MSLTLLFALMTLAPAIVAIILGVLSRVGAFRVPPAVGMALAALAAIIPIVGLILLASDLAFPTPIRFAFAGDSAAPFAPLFRADGLSAYGAWGIAALIAPLLLWCAWMDAGRSADTSQRLLAELGLVIGLEVCALQLVFSDNLLWLGMLWLVLVALAWLLGEQSAEDGKFDYLGLVSALVGPVVTMAVLLLIAVATKEHTFYGLTGHAATSPLQILVLAVALAAAGGGYPFVAWLRRRAAFTTPSGFAALLLLTLPVVVFVGARSWGALQDSRGLWPEIGAVIPPITGGIALAVLGALTIAISGLLALGRRDGRTLVALLASAQIGWGLFGLGTSQPAAGVGVVVLLATSVVGLGAMIVALLAGGVLTADDEPDGAGPAPFGVAPRPLNLIAWSIGAATALGVPFFGGFVARQLITAGTLSGTKLGIPLLGLAWLGDALFAVALIRATVLAFKAEPEDLVSDGEGEAEDETEEEAAAVSRRSSTGTELLELPGVVLALIALALGIFPQVFLEMGALFATDQVTPDGVVNDALRSVPFGYATTNSQWLPGIFWLATLLLAVVVLLIRLGTQRTVVTLETTGAAEMTGMERGALDEPGVVWADLAPAFTSSWTQVAGKQLIGGIDEDDEYAEALQGEEEGGEAGDEQPPEQPDRSAEPPKDDTPANGATDMKARDTAEAATDGVADNAPTRQRPPKGPKPAKQGAKQGTQQNTKQGAKQSTQQNTKQGAKQGTQQNTKQGAKQGAKQGSRDANKRGQVRK